VEGHPLDDSIEADEMSIRNQIKSLI